MHDRSTVRPNRRDQYKKADQETFFANLKAASDLLPSAKKLEVFANDRTCLAARIYPERADSLGLDLFCIQGSARLVTMDVWKLDSIW